MNWSKPFEKLLLTALYSAIGAGVAYFALHLGETGLPQWAMPLAQVVLTGIAAAIANAIKHINDPAAIVPAVAAKQGAL